MLAVRSLRKIQLASHVTLTYEGLVLSDLQNVKWQQQALGADTMAISDPSTRGATVVMRDVGIILGLCPPQSLILPYLLSISGPNARPDIWNITARQPGCLNRTFDANGTVVNLYRRCTAYSIVTSESATEAMGLDENGDTKNANYIFRSVNTTSLCQAAISEECIAKLGPEGCLASSWDFYVSAWAWFDRYALDVEAAYAAAQAAAAAAAAAAANRSASPQPVDGGDGAQAPAGAAPGGDGGGGGGTSVAVAAGVAAGVGVAVIVALGAGVWLWRWRRAAKSAEGSDGSSCPPEKACARATHTTLVTTGTTAEDSGISSEHAGTALSSPGAATPSPATSNQGTAGPGAAEAPQASTAPPPAPAPHPPPLHGGGPVHVHGIVTERTPFPSALPTDVQLQMQGDPGAAAPGDGPGEGAAASGAASAPGPTPGAPVVHLTQEVLGRGGFGRVYAGTMGGRAVAVKLVAEDLDRLHPRDAQLLASAFEQELAVLARCDHLCIVKVLAACAKPPRPCIVMERMETSLERMLHAKGATLLPLPTVLHIALEVARGLEFLHPTVLHRDLKPGNVLLQNASSSTPVVKISDFGISRLRQSILQTLHPEAGTPAYLAPECFDLNASGLTYKADIYSWAVLVWEALAGSRPWTGLTALEIALQVHVYGARLPMPPAVGCPGASLHRWSPRVVRLLTECFDADPQRRPAAADLVKRLLVFQQELDFTVPQDGGPGRPQGADDPVMHAGDVVLEVAPAPVERAQQDAVGAGANTAVTVSTDEQEAVTALSHV